MSNNEYRLKQEITQMSYNQQGNWEQINSEWKLIDLKWGNSDCICGKKNITQLCIIENRYNQNRTVVGSCCIKKFMNRDEDWFFSAVKNIKERKRPNNKYIEYLREIGVLDDWKTGFYLDTKNLRTRLTPKMEQKRNEIIELIYQYTMNNFVEI